MHMRNHCWMLYSSPPWNLGEEIDYAALWTQFFEGDAIRLLLDTLGLGRMGWSRSTLHRVLSLGENGLSAMVRWRTTWQIASQKIIARAEMLWSPVRENRSEQTAIDQAHVSTWTYEINLGSQKDGINHSCLSDNGLKRRTTRQDKTINAYAIIFFLFRSIPF